VRGETDGVDGGRAQGEESVDRQPRIVLNLLKLGLQRQSHDVGHIATKFANVFVSRSHPRGNAAGTHYFCTQTGCQLSNFASFHSTFVLQRRPFLIPGAPPPKS